MAKADWRRYYAPILVHKETGECRLWRGKLFSNADRARFKAFSINRTPTSNYRCIGIAGLKGRDARCQQQLWAMTRKVAL